MKETCNIQVIIMMMVRMMTSAMNTKAMMTIIFIVKITILFLNTNSAGKLVTSFAIYNLTVCDCP